MTIFYLDTSALVKRYKTEEGSDMIDYLYNNLPKGHSLATSFLTVLEFVSAIRRLLKGNRISKDDFETIISTFSQEEGIIENPSLFYFLQNSNPFCANLNLIYSGAPLNKSLPFCISSCLKKPNTYNKAG